MGRQSARLFFNGKDHKDIYYQGHYHKAMYLGSELVWEKRMEYGEFSFTVDTSIESHIYMSLIGILHIDWGDGTSNSIDNLTYSYTFQHIYSGTSIYTVKISGDIRDLWFEPIHSKIPLKNILTPFPKTMKNRTSFLACFISCVGLVEIPDNLFMNCPNATNFRECFMGCDSIESIPEGLFFNCQNAKDFSLCFSDCESLKSIPEGLFSNCPNATDFSACFSSCGSIESIPEGLFFNCPNVKSFGSCFDHMFKLKNIPYMLFANCPNVTDFSDCFYACEGVTGNVPELWMRDNVEKFAHCFYGCLNAANYESIPTDWKSGYR